MARNAEPIVERYTKLSPLVNGATRECNVSGASSIHAIVGPASFHARSKDCAESSKNHHRRTDGGGNPAFPQGTNRLIEQECKRAGERDGKEQSCAKVQCSGQDDQEDSSQQGGLNGSVLPCGIRGQGNTPS
jgi:hypothetical protein